MTQDNDDKVFCPHGPYCDDEDPYELCNCGANVICRTCGHGKGQMPCECNKDSFDGSWRTATSYSSADWEEVASRLEDHFERYDDVHHNLAQ